MTIDLPGGGLSSGDSLHLDIEQGTAEWRLARCGIPTASNFYKMLTPNGTPSRQAGDYLQKLVAEWQTGNPASTEPNEWMLRGIELEPQARSFYEQHTGSMVKQIGLVYLDDRRLIAASPDGLIGADGLLEIKCPAPHNHTACLSAAAMPRKYLPQVQGQLWVTGRQWTDFLSYHPDFEPLIVRIGRNEKYIVKLAQVVENFVINLLKNRQQRSQT